MEFGNKEDVTPPHSTKWPFHKNKKDSTKPKEVVEKRKLMQAMHSASMLL